MWLGAIQGSGLKTPIFTYNSKYKINAEAARYKQPEKI